MPLLKPVAGPVSQRFGNRNFAPEPVGYFANAADGRALKAYSSRFPGSYYEHDLHKGVDIYGSLGKPIAAPESGTVVEVNRTLGNLRVRIQGHSNVWWSIGHCDTIKVSVGAKVKRGQIVATMGKRGNATGVHVHLMVEISERHSDGVTRRMAYDALRFLPAKSYSWGGPYGSGYLPGGNLAFDERIYPIHQGSVLEGVNVRANPDTAAAIVLTTPSQTTVTVLNEQPGGSYTVDDKPGTMWAKVKLPNGRIAHVASPLLG